jgi:hypothetical protein
MCLVTGKHIVQLYGGVVVVWPSAVTKKVDSFHQHFMRIRSKLLDGFVDEVLQRHGTGITGLPRTHQFGLNIRRSQFDYLYARILQQIALR